jgi:hypothetical protein
MRLTHLALFTFIVVSLRAPLYPAHADQGAGASTTSATRSSTGTRSETEREGDKRIAVNYRNEPVLYLAERSSAVEKTDRAKAAARALASALDAKDSAVPGARAAEVRTLGTATIALYVRGFFVTEMHPDDARASGYDTLDQYAKDLDEWINSFVKDQQRRSALQGLTLSTMIALLIAFGGVVMIRLFGKLFDRAEDLIFDRRALVRPVTILRVPIISEETIGATLTFALTIGRVVAYVAASLTTLSLILAQFETTRALVGGALEWASAPMLSGVQGLGHALPGLILAAALLVALRGALRVATGLLNGIASGRASWRGIRIEQVPVLRLVVPTVLALAFAPLVIAAAFGQFHTPLELFVVAACGAGLLGLVPWLAAGTVGLAVLWRSSIRLGYWFDSGRASGRVVRISPWEIVVSREPGEEIAFPMLALLLHPVHCSPLPPKRTMELVAARSRGPKQIVEIVRSIVNRADSRAQVTCIAFTEETIHLRVETEGAADGRAELMLRIQEESEREGVALREARVV